MALQTLTYSRLGRMPPVSYMNSDEASVRSSSEATAATIFSMYEDPVPANTSDAPPVPVLDPKYKSMGTDSSRPVSTMSEVEARRSRDGYAPVSYGAGTGAVGRRTSANRRSYGVLEGGNRPSLNQERPSISQERPVNGHERRSRQSTADGRRSIHSDGHSAMVQDPGPSEARRNVPLAYPARQGSLQQPADQPRTPSPRLVVSTMPYPGGSSPVSPQDGELLTPAERERRPSSKHSTRTAFTSQTTHTTHTTHTAQTSHTEYTIRHSTEDADAFRVRATYARLEAEGVPGDGWLEGVERTRTRVVSAASAAVLEATKGAGGKGANVGREEEARLRSTDRCVATSGNVRLANYIADTGFLRSLVRNMKAAWHSFPRSRSKRLPRRTSRHRCRFPRLFPLCASSRPYPCRPSTQRKARGCPNGRGCSCPRRHPARAAGELDQGGNGTRAKYANARSGCSRASPTAGGAQPGARSSRKSGSGSDRRRG
jgi:hypothetical protein